MAQLQNLLVTGDSRFLNEIHGKIDWSNVLSKPTIPTVTDTYSATGTAATSGKAVAAALGTLDGSITGTPGAGKTLTAFSQTDGKVSATFGNISITKSQVSDFPTSMTPTSHTHGNIQNGGTLQTNDITIASGDKLVVTDSSDSSKIARTSISFDGSTANKCLTQKGTWESFTNNTGTVTSVKVGSTSYSPSSGVVSLPAYPTTLPASDTTSTYSATGTAPVNGTAVAVALATIPSGIVPSAYCDTAAGTAAKTATCTGYTLTTGNYIQVIIKNANSYNGAITLAINGTTAKPIYINGTASSSSNKTLPAGSYEVYYDGTAYQFRTDGVLPGKVVEATKVNGHTVAKDVPSNAVFTDTNNAVLQSPISTNNYFEILFSHSANNTAETAGVGKDGGFFYNPYYNSVTIGGRNSSATIGDRSFEQGWNVEASGSKSHAEGYNTTASGDYSHAEGDYTTANHLSQHVFGEYNISDPSTNASTARGTYVEIVGNGTSSATSNARTLDWSGNQWIAGNYSDTNGLLAMKEVTQSQYDALTTDEKNNGTAYFITDRLSPAATDLWAKVGTATLTTVAQGCSGAINELKTKIDNVVDAVGLANIGSWNAATTATAFNLSSGMKFSDYRFLVIQIRNYNNIIQTQTMLRSYFEGTSSGTRPLFYINTDQYIGHIEIYYKSDTSVYIKVNTGNKFTANYRVYILGVQHSLS